MLTSNEGYKLTTAFPDSSPYLSESIRMLELGATSRPISNDFSITYLQIENIILIRLFTFGVARI